MGTDGRSSDGRTMTTKMTMEEDEEKEEEERRRMTPHQCAVIHDWRLT